MFHVSIGGFIVKCGESWGSIGLGRLEGGSKKIVIMFSPNMGNPEQYPFSNLLNCLRSIGKIFITTEID